jgi:uridine phosphorylase
MGGALSGDCVLALAEAGAREVIFTGSCGGLPPCGIGDVIVCTSALDGEGFSRYHGPVDQAVSTINTETAHKPDAGFSDIIYERMVSMMGEGTGLYRGGIFTTGSLLSETPDNMRVLRDKGVIGIDMETSAVLCAARSRNIKAAAVMTVSDLPLYSPFWNKLEKKSAKKYEHTFETVLLNLIDITENPT